MEDFQAASWERRQDAASLLKDGRTLAALYMSGYTVECALKALLLLKGKSVPRSGRGGHDLMSLWRTSNLRLRDLGEKGAAFVQYWTTSLRYETEIPLDHEGLLSGADMAYKFVNKLYRSEQSKSNRRRRS